jgi:hypothetical protein
LIAIGGVALLLFSAGGGEFRAGTSRVITARWKPPQQVSGFRLGPKRGHEPLDLVLGPSRRPIQDLDDVAFVEHVAQLDQRGQVEAAVDQAREGVLVDPAVALRQR